MLILWQIDPFHDSLLSLCLSPKSSQADVAGSAIIKATENTNLARVYEHNVLPLVHFRLGIACRAQSAVKGSLLQHRHALRRLPRDQVPFTRAKKGKVVHVLARRHGGDAFVRQVHGRDLCIGEAIQCCTITCQGEWCVYRSDAQLEQNTSPRLSKAGGERHTHTRTHTTNVPLQM